MSSRLPSTAMPIVEVTDEMFEDTSKIQPTLKERLLAEAVSTEHLMRHLRKNPMCETCRRAKAQFPHHKSVQPEDKTKYEHFGQMVTGDNLRLHRDDNVGISGEVAGILLKDLCTGQLYTDCSH